MRDHASLRENSVLQLELTRYREPLSHVSHHFTADEVTGEDGAYRVAAPVGLDFDLHKDKTRFRLVGQLRTTLELPCSRCAEPFQLGVVAPFDVRYVPAGEAVPVDREVGEDDLDTSEYRDEVIDLGELVHEQLYLVLPMKPLCSESCKGLCPQCGTNLNVETCSCSTRVHDPRLAVLARLADGQRES